MKGHIRGLYNVVNWSSVCNLPLVASDEKNLMTYGELQSWSWFMLTSVQMGLDQGTYCNPARSNSGHSCIHSDNLNRHVEE